MRQATILVVKNSARLSQQLWRVCPALQIKHCVRLHPGQELSFHAEFRIIFGTACVGSIYQLYTSYHISSLVSTFPLVVFRGNWGGTRPPPQLCTGIHKHFKDPFRFDDSAVRMSVSIDIHKQLVNPNGSDDSAVRMSVSTGIHKHAMDP